MTTPGPATDTAEDPRVEPLARALHPGEWWDSSSPLYAMDKDAHIGQARRLLAVIDAADAATGIRRVTLDEAIERAAKAALRRVYPDATWGMSGFEMLCRERVRPHVIAALDGAP